MYIVKTLREFQYIDEEGKDEGANVRQKAKDISNLLMDDERLRAERKSRAQMQERMTGRKPIRQSGEVVAVGSSGTTPQLLRTPPAQSRNAKEEEELRLAIEESKRSLELVHTSTEDTDMQRAIKLSVEEEEKRRRAMLEQAANPGSTAFNGNSQV